jgi:hypothetical protein
MKRGQSRPSSNDSAVPDTAPMAKVTAVSFAQTCASRRASASWWRIHRHSAISISSGIATPIAAKIMWKPSESSICTRAAVSGDMSRPVYPVSRARSPATFGRRCIPARDTSFGIQPGQEKMVEFPG